MRTLLALLLLGIAGPAAALPAPAKLGDYTVGAGPAFVLDRGNPGGGAVAEGNLLYGLFSLGLHLRGHMISGEFKPAAGMDLAFAGLIGAGASVQEAGTSIDGLLALPIPIYAWEPWYLSVAWRPSFLLDGGSIHEFSLQLKFSSLLVPSDD